MSDGFWVSKEGDEGGGREGGGGGLRGGGKEMRKQTKKMRTRYISRKGKRKAGISVKENDQG